MPSSSILTQTSLSPTYFPTRPPLRAMVHELIGFLSAAHRASRINIDPTAPASANRGAVLVIPTLFRGDPQTRSLREELIRNRYAAFGWGLGTDWGPTPTLMTGVESRLIELSGTHGPVSLIGLSMGGLFCRWLALNHPDRVRQVITVCSPFRSPIDSFWLPLRPMLKIWGMADLEIMAHALEQNLPVPSAALYSRRDGVVAWQSCIDPQHPETSWEIDGGHMTISSNPSVRQLLIEQLDGQATP